MYESSIGHNSSGNSNGVLLVLSLFIIFLLSGSNISITGGFENSLSLDGVENFLEGFFLLFIRLRWGEWNNI